MLHPPKDPPTNIHQVRWHVLIGLIKEKREKVLKSHQSKHATSLGGCLLVDLLVDVALLLIVID